MRGIVEYGTGLPAHGIAVATGGVVVTTGPDGRFVLPRQPEWGNFVVLSRPPGYTANPWWHPVPDDKNAPGDDDIELRFVLLPETQQLPYQFVHMTDPHMTTPEVVASGGHGSGLYKEGSLPDQFTAFLASIPTRAPGARSVMITGDLVDHGLEEEFEALTDVLLTSPLPTHVIPGNHDHMDGVHRRVISRNNYLTNAGDPRGYERRVGPRFYSFTIADLHVVALDWHSHEIGVDHKVQNDWVRADLGALAAGSPYIILCHDQPGHSILDSLPWAPVATFSGHWHTSRVVDVDGTLHVNTPTSLFAGLDYSPPAYRVVTWDGEHITLETRTVTEYQDTKALPDVRTATFAPATVHSADPAIVWRASSSGAGHRQPVRVDGDIVLVGSQIEDSPTGRVEAFDLNTGALRWRRVTGSAVKTTPAVDHDLVVAAEVSGALIALDRDTGEPRWQLESPDPYRRFTWGTPVIADGIVYYGAPSDLRAADVRTGQLIWQRTDLAPHHNLLNHAAPLIVGDRLVIGFWPTPTNPIALDIRTGEDVWHRDPIGPATPLAVLKRLLVMGTATYDADRDQVVMPAHGQTIAVDREDGTIRWQAPHPGGFNPATPLITPHGYAIAISGLGLRMIDPKTGESLWTTEISGAAPFPMASYTKTPHPTLAPPILDDGELLIPGLDGVIRRFDLGGSERGTTRVSSPIAAPLTLSGLRAIAVATDGTIIAFDTERVARH